MGEDITIAIIQEKGSIANKGTLEKLNILVQEPP